MKRRYYIFVPGMMVLALGMMQAQDNPAPTSDSQTSPQQPIAAYGQENAPQPITENPPLSGLDLPSLQEHAAPLSYLQPGATVSESATTNLGNNLGGNNSIGSITRALGSLTLKRLWSHYDLGLQYMGGVGYYDRSGIGLKQLQDMTLDQKIQWKRGQLSLLDSFSYLPEGNFGASYGSLGSTGIASIGSTGLSPFMGGSGLGSFGLTPRIMNVSAAELAENLNPKSAITATGGYAFTHFYNTGGTSFIGSSEITGQGGYNRTLNPHSQIAASYGYQAFDFSITGLSFHTNVFQGMYGHRISGRLDLLLGAGPQLTRIGGFGTNLSTKIGVAAQARLRYRITRNMLDLRYSRFETSGGGLFAGAETDLVRFDVEHPLSRIWSVSVDVGYSHNERLQEGCLVTTPCPAGGATTYTEGFAGAALHRYFGRTLHGFASYQFSELDLNHSFCTSSAACNRISNRQVVTFGLDWTPRPIRID